MFICWMDRIVWFILMMVFSNLLVEITGVPPKKVINIKTEKEDLSHLNEIVMPKDVEIINKEISLKRIATPTSVSTRGGDLNIKVDTKNKIISPAQQQAILDSIFNIPIATLKAVNDLVQVIVGSIVQIPGTNTRGQNIKETAKQQRIRFRHKNTKDLNLTVFNF